MSKKSYERPLIRKLETGMPGKFGLRNDLTPATHIDNIPVAELVENFGSPLFVISEQTIVQTFNKAKRAFTTRYPRVQFAWSYKTNYMDAVCRIFHREGSWAEVVSGFEYEKALRNGVDGKKIIFNGPEKSREDLTKAIRNDSLIHIDHLDELYELVELSGELGIKPRVAIRVNMDTGIYPQWDRFGFNLENGQAWDAINKIVHSGKMELTGLHCHIGTFILSAGAYGIAASKLALLAIDIRNKFNINLKYLDLGGGFASRNTLKGSYLPGPDINPGFEDYAEAISSSLHNSGFSTEELPLLILETGRALIDEAGYMISTVIGNKRLASGSRSTIIDAGVNLLFTSFWYDHKVMPAQPFSLYREETLICGPLCMNIDIIRNSVSLPMLKKGDRLVIFNTGAYNMTQWMQFITMRPAIVLISSEGTVNLIRRKEDNDTLANQEVVPAYLSK
ncbi:MAG: diaminopimelate decarboxylase [Bacteroidales bacterium]|nr:diaminopimelate decarboxylase [Bacteroidales bacterium]